MGKPQYDFSGTSGCVPLSDIPIAPLRVAITAITASVLTSAHKVPVLVVRGKLLVDSGLDNIDPGGQMDLREKEKVRLPSPRGTHPPERMLP